MAQVLEQEFGAVWFPKYHRMTIDTGDAVVTVDYDWNYSDRLNDVEQEHLRNTLGFVPRVALYVEANPIHLGSANQAERVVDTLTRHFTFPAVAR